MVLVLGRWIYQHFAPRYFFTPFANVHHMTSTRGVLTNTIIGYTDAYIFGIRICRLQRTKPWEGK